MALALAKELMAAAHNDDFEQLYCPTCGGELALYYGISVKDVKEIKNADIEED